MYKGKAAQSYYACKYGARYDTDPDVAVLAVQISDDACGASHHVAVAEGEVQSAGRAVDTLKRHPAGSSNKAAAILNNQKEEERESGHDGVHGDGYPHVLALIAGAWQDALADVAGEHDYHNNYDALILPNTWRWLLFFLGANEYLFYSKNLTLIEKIDQYN